MSDAMRVGGESREGDAEARRPWPISPDDSSPELLSTLSYMQKLETVVENISYMNKIYILCRNGCIKNS